MSDAYYQAEQWLAQVDRDDNIIGKIEKWEAHKKGILHRGYTAILEFNGQIILQHRKHPVFDNVYDLSFSSHQLYIHNHLQTNEEAIFDGLKREWSIKKGDVKELTFVNKIYYIAKDQKSGYVEHEVDYIYTVELGNPPTAEKEYAYGQQPILKVDLDQIINHLPFPPAPWVNKILAEKLI